VLFTTNCIQKPADDYKDRIFTTGLVGWPGCTHIEDKDFTPVIEKALSMDGWTDDEDNGSVMVGFARNAVLGVADKIIDAVKNKAIRHFFLVGGCDGAKPGRDYYTRFVEQVPDDCVVLTLACGKFRRKTPATPSGTGAVSGQADCRISWRDRQGRVKR